MNWKGYERNWQCPNLKKKFPGISAEGMWTTAKIISQYKWYSGRN
jgi:hypothetical protein